jgi:hypothetical protein
MTNFVISFSSMLIDTTFDSNWLFYEKNANELLMIAVSRVISSIVSILKEKKVIRYFYNSNVHINPVSKTNFICWSQKGSKLKNTKFCSYVRYYAPPDK